MEGSIARHPSDPRVAYEGRPQGFKVAAVLQWAFEGRAAALGDGDVASPHGLSSENRKEDEVTHEVLVVVHADAVAHPWT